MEHVAAKQFHSEQLVACMVQHNMHSTFVEQKHTYDTGLMSPLNVRVGLAAGSRAGLVQGATVLVMDACMHKRLLCPKDCCFSLSALVVVHCTKPCTFYHCTHASRQLADWQSGKRAGDLMCAAGSHALLPLCYRRCQLFWDTCVNGHAFSSHKVESNCSLYTL